MSEFDGDRRPEIGDRVQFEGKRTSWLARAESQDGRYLLLTAGMFGTVFYTIIDWQSQVRGPMTSSAAVSALRR